MPLFSSKREKRLWLSVLFIIIAIYLTLGLVSPLAGLLRDRGLLTPVFIFGLILVGITILTQGLKTRPGGIEIAVAIGITATYLLMLARMAVPEATRGHLIEYSVVAIFIYEALLERVRQGRHVPAPALLAIVVTSLLGVLDECIQAILPSRVFDPLDMLFNFWAGVLAVGASVALGWVRNIYRKKRTKK